MYLGWLCSGNGLGDSRCVSIHPLYTLNETQLHLQTLVAAGTIGQVTFIGKFESLVNKANRATLSLFIITVTHLIAHFQQGQCHLITTNQQIAHVGCQSCHEVTTIKALLQHVVEEEKTFWHTGGKEMVNKLEVIFLTQDIQVLANTFVSQVSARETYHLVEDGKCVAHTTVGLLCNERKGFRLCCITFLLSHIHQVVDGILRGHPLEIINLASA